MKKYKAVVFDFDMTLADTSVLIVGFLNETVQHFGYPAMSYEKALPIVGNTHEIMLAHVSGEKDWNKVSEMRAYYRELIGKEMAAKTVLFDDAPSCLRTIRGKGIKLGLLSQKLHKVLEESLAVNSMDGVFDAITGVEDQPVPKPDPSGLLLTLRQLDVTVEDALYVGDSLVDQGTAQAAGVDFAAMLKGGTKKSEFDAELVKRFYSSPSELEADIRALM